MKPDEYANGKGIADSQIRCCRSLCRQTLEKAVEEHLILCNLAIGCKCPPAKREEMKFPQGKLCREYSSRPKRKITMNSSLWSLPEYKTKVDSRWMFPSPKKEDLPMRPSSPHKRLHRILDYAGCERVRFHGPCHTFATNA